MNFWGGLGAVVLLALMIAMALATKRKQWNKDDMTVFCDVWNLHI